MVRPSGREAKAFDLFGCVARNESGAHKAAAAADKWPDSKLEKRGDERHGRQAGRQADAVVQAREGEGERERERERGWTHMADANAAARARMGKSVENKRWFERGRKEGRKAGGRARVRGREGGGDDGMWFQPAAA